VSNPKKVYLEPTWRYHAYAHQLLASPPEGYEFVTPRKPVESKLLDTLSHSGIGRPGLERLDSVLPTSLIKSWLERWSQPPRGTVLTYACDHLVFRPEPWVVEVEYAGLLLGADLKHFKRFKRTLEKALASPFCRKIICWSEASRKGLLADLECNGFAHKVELVDYAVPPRHFVKVYPEQGRRKTNDGKKTRLLLVGSGTGKGAFDARGGREVLEMFSILRQRYSNLELVIRSDVPAEVKSKYGGMDGLRLIESMVPWEELEREFRSADIFVLPSHATMPMNILDAMSYELPVVTVDYWANKDIVEDGRTGLVAHGFAGFSPHYPGTHQPAWTTSGYKVTQRKTDPAVIADLVEKVSLLIENAGLRQKLGKAGRAEVEQGRFSLKRRNDKLKQIFDEAIAGDAKSPVKS